MPTQLSYLVSSLKTLREQFLFLSLFTLLFTIAYLVTTPILFSRTETEDESEWPLHCTTNLQCSSLVTELPCQESICNTTSGSCEIIIAGSGECSSNLNCQSGYCDPGTCACGTLTVCSENVTCPPINECLESTCTNNTCFYAALETSQCVFDSDCSTPGARCESCQCTEEDLICDVQDYSILYDEIQTFPVAENYFGGCGSWSASDGNLSVGVCMMYSGGIGGKLQVYAKDEQGNWVKKAFVSDLTNNWLNAQVEIKGDYILLGKPFGFDPIAVAVIGTSELYRYNRTDDTLELLQRFSFNDNPTFFPLRIGFGFSLGISEDFIIIDGVIASISGAFTSIVYVYNRTSDDEAVFLQGIITPFEPILSGTFIQSIDVNQDILVFGVLNSINNSAIVVHAFNETSGMFELLYTFPEDGASNGINYGFRVATDGETIIGATQANSVQMEPPVVYVLDREGNIIVQIEKPEYSESVFNGFATSLDVQGDKMVVGCSSCNGIQSSSGAFYLYLRTEEGEWNFYKKGYPYDNPFLASNLFGVSISLNQEYIVIGASGYDSTGNITPNPGALYISECLARK